MCTFNNRWDIPKSASTYHKKYHNRFAIDIFEKSEGTTKGHEYQIDTSVTYVVGCVNYTRFLLRFLPRFLLRFVLRFLCIWSSIFSSVFCSIFYSVFFFNFLPRFFLRFYLRFYIRFLLRFFLCVHDACFSPFCSIFYFVMEGCM